MLEYMDKQHGWNQIFNNNLMFKCSKCKYYIIGIYFGHRPSLVHFNLQQFNRTSQLILYRAMKGQAIHVFLEEFLCIYNAYDITDYVRTYLWYEAMVEPTNNFMKVLLLTFRLQATFVRITYT